MSYPVDISGVSRLLLAKVRSSWFLGAVECLAPAVRGPYAASDLAFTLTEDGTMVFVPNYRCIAKAH